MRLQQLIVLILIVIINEGFCQEKEFSPTYKTILNPVTEKIVVKQCSRPVPKKIKKLWIVSDKEVEILENNFQKINQLTSLIGAFGTGITSFNDFGFQYLGITIKKKKYIYINAFRLNPQKSIDSQYQDWTKRLIIACDGGYNFWGVLFDLENLDFKELNFNGY